MNKTKILILDDHEVFLEGMKYILKETKEFDVETTTKESKLVEKISGQEIGVFILDFIVPGTKILELIDGIRQSSSKSKIIVLSSMKDKKLFSTLQEKKVDGYIFKSEARNVIVDAIHKILDGGTYYSDIQNVSFEKIESLTHENPFSVLTEKEIQILGYIAKGLSNKKIADELKISARTVEAHKRNIDMKLGKIPKSQLGKLAAQWKIVA